MLYPFIDGTTEDEVDGAALGLRTGADGDDTGRVGTEAGAATGSLSVVGAAGASSLLGEATLDVSTGASTDVGAATGASTEVGAATGTSTGPSVASNVHVLGQLIKTKHSHGNG